MRVIETCGSTFAGAQPLILWSEQGDLNPTHSPPVALARAYGRYGYRRITALLNEAGWDVSVSRVARIWRREGLKVPGRRPKL